MDKKAKVLVASLVVVALLALAFAVAKPSKPAAVKECRDGIDNDGDGLVDYPEDPGCTDKNDWTEAGDSECDDGLDNDGDGAADLADTGCSSAADDDESDCGDGVCEGGEDCDSCAADCLGAGEVCCYGLPYTGECCFSTDCAPDESCVGFYCVPADSCSDSDGGNVPEVQGTVTGYLLGEPYEHTDYCNTSMMLVEHVCLGTSWWTAGVECSACVDGACT